MSRTRSSLGSSRRMPRSTPTWATGDSTRGSSVCGIEDVEAFVRCDFKQDRDGVRCRAHLEAVRKDVADIMLDGRTWTAITRVSAPVRLLAGRARVLRRRAADSAGRARRVRPRPPARVGRAGQRRQSLHAGHRRRSRPAPRCGDGGNPGTRRHSALARAGPGSGPLLASVTREQRKGCGLVTSNRTYSAAEDRDFKAGQRAVWAGGNYHEFARRALWGFGHQLVEACGIGPGQRVLDVAAGSGNVAIRAALAGAEVVASDLTPENFEAGRREALGARRADRVGGGRRGGAAVCRRRVRRRHFGLRSRLRAAPPGRGQRAAACLPAGRHDRADGARAAGGARRRACRLATDLPSMCGPESALPGATSSMWRACSGSASTRSK